jgi:hypothetical protein
MVDGGFNEHRCARRFLRPFIRRAEDALEEDEDGGDMLANGNGNASAALASSPKDDDVAAEVDEKEGETNASPLPRQQGTEIKRVDYH